MSNKSLLSISGIVVLGAILLLSNALSQRWFTSSSLDLTEEGLYSLSDGTKNIIKSIEDPITLRYYFSKTDASGLPGFKLYADRVHDMLEEYEQVGRGKIKLESFDVRQDSEEEEWAQKYGLTPFSLPSGERLFFGLAGSNGAGDEASIAAFNLGRQEFLEYDISKMIHSLVVKKRPVVAILSSIDVKGSQVSPMARMQGQEENPPWFFTGALNETSELRYLDTAVTTIAPEIGTLMLIHPKNLSDQALYAIDQFVLRGGNLLVFTDPYCQADKPPTDPQNPMAAMTAARDSNLNRLLATWGVEQVDKKAVADINLGTKVNSGRGGPVRDYVVWLTLGEDNLNRENVVTSSLDSMLLPWAGMLKINKVDGVQVEPLLTTTREAMALDQTEFQIGGGDPDALLKDYVRGSEQFVLGALISGKLKTNFPDGAPGQPAESSAGNVHLAESKSVSHVVVVADADMLSDGFSVAQQNIFGRKLVTPLNDNLAFVLNMVENLAGSSDLISIRSRGKFSRPFTRVQAIEAAAQSRYQREESLFQAQLNGANQRLSQLQASGNKDGGEQLFSKAVLDEIKRLREERKEAQQRLREVRLRLREDKEALGSALFLVNTFLVPVLLIFGSIVYFALSARRRKQARKVV